MLSGISTQGHKSRKEWVTKFSVLYSSDGGIYDTYKALGQNEVSRGDRNIPWLLLLTQGLYLEDFNITKVT